jgi:hypothetical protein
MGAIRDDQLGDKGNEILGWFVLSLLVIGAMCGAVFVYIFLTWAIK